MNRKLLVSLVGILAVAAGILWFVLGRSSQPATKADVAAGRTSVAPMGKPGADPLSGATTPGEAADEWDRDPVGTEPLEGQVLDEDDQPVKGAEVSLSSNPQRKATTADDGTFTFDKAFHREYTLNARAGDRIGGPVQHYHSPTSGPAVLRLRPGATLEVRTVDAASKPLAGVAVKLDDSLSQEATTDASGKATFRGVDPGGAVVSATKEGYAPSNAVAQVSVANVVPVTLVMRTGGRVSGKVVDEAGKGVAGADVSVSQATGGWFLPSYDRIKSDDKGEFAFAALAAGSYRFSAHHPTLAPGTSRVYTLDGNTEETGVEITLAPGAEIKGLVVDAGGAPVVGANVRVAAKEGMGGMILTMAGVQQAISDERGEFKVRGLARAAVRVQAQSEQATSQAKDVDLAATPQVKDLKLVVDIVGEISGVVVDSSGEPVAEASVSAVSDIWEGGDVKSFALSGFSTAVTDGGGAFRIRGLTDGAYRLHAHRSAAHDWWRKKGTAARTGDKHVRLVLPSPGKIVGRVAVDPDGRAPSLATVSVGWDSPTPVIAGAFTLAELAPGSYDIVLRGADFPETSKRKVTVTAGKTTDVGTIKVKPGRRVVGKVVDAKGAGVGGAKVSLGTVLVTDDMDEDQVGQSSTMRHGTTDADGTFTLVGVGDKEAKIVGEHATGGRSMAATVPAGTGTPPPITLTLRGFGSIAGKVTRKGKPETSGFVSASPKGGESKLAFVPVGPDGTYLIDKVPEGPTTLSASGGGEGIGMGAMGSAEVVVKAGQRANVDIVLPAGDIKLDVTVRAPAGQRVDAAQVFLLRGQVAMKSAKELMDVFTQNPSAIAGMAFAMGQNPAAFTELLPGEVSICTIPITGDMQDPQFSARLQRHSDRLVVYCMAKVLPADPRQQSTVHEVPQMAPLPED